jgi:hypothetical protein
MGSLIILCPLAIATFSTSFLDWKLWQWLEEFLKREHGFWPVDDMADPIGFNARVDSFTADKTTPSRNRVGTRLLAHEDLDHVSLATYTTH